VSRILVLLLPEQLESFEHRPLVDELLLADGVVAVDPPKTSYERLARLPGGFAAGVSHKQAKRLRKRLPGEPSAIAIFAPAQYLLARGIIAQVAGCALWYRPPGAFDDERLEELHGLAVERAAVVFGGTDELWEPLEALELSSLRGRGAGRRAGRR
jgi:hypothetical protein